MPKRFQRRTSKRAYSSIKRQQGKRSGLEVQVATQLGAFAEYEPHWIEYERPTKPAKYRPDFKLKNGIYIEVKGWFKTEDRQKHLLIKYQHPELDIRFVFSNPQTKIGKQSKTTYAQWCERNGFQYAKGVVPKEWLDEKKN